MTIPADTPRSVGDKAAPHLSPVTPEEDARTVLLNRISWGAVLAGVVVGLVVQLILNMIGVGIGAATFHPMTGDNPEASTFSIVAAVWWTVSGIIAAFAGGLAAGRLAGKPKESTAGWHGLTAWALTTLVVFYLLTTAIGGIIGGVFSTISSAAGGLGRTAATAAQAAAPAVAQANDPVARIEQAVRDATGGNDPAALRDAAVSAVRAVVTGNPDQAQQARERAAQAISKAQNISIDDARKQVQQYEEQYRQAVEQAKQQAAKAADAAASAVSKGSLFGAIALVLGAIAGWFGGRAGKIDPTLTSGDLRAGLG
jgi:hypothetical protein